MIQIRSIEQGFDVEIIRELFMEYARDLDLNLDLGGIDRDFNNLPGIYSPPSGCLLLAIYKDIPAGCVGLSKIDELTCEIKRLFVRRQYRNLGIGRKLAVNLVERAKKIGYRHMRLDVLASLREAKSLYESIGFTVTETIQDELSRGVYIMELHL